MAETTEAGRVAELVAQGGAMVLTGPDDRKFLIQPNTTRMTEISDENGRKLTKPRYVRQEVTIEERDSLVTYVQRFGTALTMLFADLRTSSIVAAVDYHGASEGVGTIEPAKSEHVVHRATCTLQISEEWKDWASIDGRMMSQTEFARWLKEHGGDVSAPAGAVLLEVCMDLQSTRRVNFKQAVRTNSEVESFEYAVDADVSAATKSLDVPEKFTLRIPVYFGESTVELEAFLRWNITEHGQLQLGVKLSRAEYVRQAMFKQIVGEVGAATGCPIVYGRIEDDPDFDEVD